MPGRVSLSDMQQMLDPQNTFDWAIWLPTVPGGPYSSRDFTFRAQSTNVPALTVQEFTVEAQGITSQWPGKRIWDMKLDVTIFETRDGVGKALMEGWLDLIRNVRNNTGSYSAAYAIQAELDLYDAPGNITQRIGLTRFYPLSIGTATLDNTSGLMTYQCSFSYDRTLPLPLNT